jgi:hypothetical protein
MFKNTIALVISGVRREGEACSIDYCSVWRSALLSGLKTFMDCSIPNGSDGARYYAACR